MNIIKNNKVVSKELAIKACIDALATLTSTNDDTLQGFHICVNPTVAQIDIYWDNIR